MSNNKQISDQEFTAVTELFYAGKWDECEAEIGRLKEIYPEGIKLDFLESMIFFWTFYYCGKQPSVGRKFIELSENIISESKTSVKETDDDILLLKSGLLGYQALTHVSLMSFKDALKSGKKAYEITTELEKRNIKDDRAAIGFGMFNYMLGSVPSQLKFATKMMGLSGDKEKGMEYLHQASESDLYIRFDGRMLLAELFARDSYFEEALKKVEISMEESPDHLVFLLKAANLCGKLGKADQRETYLNKILENTDTHFGYQRKEARRMLG
jgi:tetratricopeptide (TPR) repeat protein